MDLSQYAELFLAESKEHLSSVNGHLLEWERNRGAGEPVDAIFRAMHTIKGMAATMGYQVVAGVAHNTENLLEVLRSGGEEPTDDTIDLLFRAVDTIEQAVDAAVAGRESESDVTELLNSLDAVTRTFRPPTEEPDAPQALPVVGPSLEGPGCWVRVTLDQDCALKGARATIILSRVQEMGTIHAVQPAAAVLESDSFDGSFDFRIETSIGEELIEKEIREAGDVVDVVIGAADSGQKLTEGTGGPSKHIRVDLRRLDALMNNIGELVTARDRLLELTGPHTDPELNEVVAKVFRLTATLQSEIVEARMTPVWQVFDRFPRLVRDLSRKLGKQIDFEIEGKEIELDRAILDELGDPLVHLIRNAVDHGVETPTERKAAGKPPKARITLSAVGERATVAIRVADDGRGINREKVLTAAKQSGLADDDVDVLTDELLIRVLARPGFSTAGSVSDVSGRGVGIDAVATQLRALGGGLEVRSQEGIGTIFTLRLPVTLAIVRALTAKVGEERYVMPITHVAETVDLEPEAITELEGQNAMTLRDDIIPLVHLRDLVNAPGEPPRRRPVIVLQIGERRSGLVVDAIAGQQEIVVRSFDPPQGTLPVFSGATVLGDGEPALILDAGGLV